MTYVSDTVALVYFATDDFRHMGPRASRIFRRAEERRDLIHVPVICLFELAQLLERGRVRSRMSLLEWHALVTGEPNLPLEPLTWEDVREARGLAKIADPFDRLIAGTAIRLDAPLITSDERIRRSGLVPTVW
jgi:PIN domain nuclease of toxin-antitoxin system